MMTYLDLGALAPVKPLNRAAGPSDARLALLADVAPRERVAQLRNATAVGGPAIEPVEQNRLQDFLRVLVRAYGWRPDAQPVNPPRSLPYVPLPFAGVMVASFEQRASDWLRRSDVIGLQPTYIKNRIAEVRSIVGDVDATGIVTRPNEASLEAAPAAVAAKAPVATWPVPHPITRPHPQVLTASATWDFLDRLVRLARHLDLLLGAPTKLDLFGQVLGEQVDQVLEKSVELAQRGVEAGVDVLASIPKTVAGALRAPGQLLDGAKSALTIAGLVAAGLLGLYLVSR
jgi:hypothetical protein